MAHVTYLLSNFTGGELSRRIDGRSDVSKYKNGCRLIENFTVLPHGGARKRSGTKYVVEAKNATDTIVLVPFQFNVEQSYMLAFGPNYIWFLKDQGIITFPAITITNITMANPAVVTATGHGYTNGDRVIITGVSGMTEVNNRQFTVAGATTNTFQLSGVDSSLYTVFSSGGTVSKIVELTTTYSSTEIADLTFAQSADTLYVAHPAHPLSKITRSSHTSWTLSIPSITTGPFRTINADRNNKITVSAFSSAATSYGTHIVGETFTMTAVNSGTFTSTMVGSLWRMNEEGGATGVGNAPVGTATAIAAGNVYTNETKVYGVFQVSGTATWSPFTRVPAHEAGTVRVKGTGAAYFDADFLHPGYCVVQITGYTNSRVVTAQIVRYQMAESIVTSGTSFWEEGAWSPKNGYPRAVTFFDQRLFLAGSNGDPNVLWGSRVAAFEDFEDGTDDADALVYRVSSGLADTIRWIMSGRALTAGSSAGEYAVAASTQNEALTPSNFKANAQTSYGTSSCPPIRVNQSVLYPQRSGSPANAALKIREFTYEYTNDAFNSTDITIFSEHITGQGITRLAYQTEPDSVIYARRTDGTLAACTYERKQEVVAWHRHLLGGNNAQVTNIAVMPGTGGDELWLSVQRFLGDSPTIGFLAGEDDSQQIAEDGSQFITDETVQTQYIEVLQSPFRDTGDKSDAFFVDAGLSYTGDLTATISGLWHLRGTTVSVLNNGAVETATVSSTGKITLANATAKAAIGLGFTAKLQTEDMDGGAQAGTAQSRMKRIGRVFARVLNSLGGKVGSSASDAKPLLYRTGATPMGTSPPLASQLVELNFPGGWDREATIYMEHSDPLPFHLTGIVAELNTIG